MSRLTLKVSGMLAAGLLAMLPAFAAAPAKAGDLGGYPEPRAYDQSGDYYVPPRGGSYKDDPLPPPAPPRRYSEDRSGCTPKHIIRDRLVGKGWHDFQPPELRGDLAIVRARARSGDMYVLKVHRCTGDIVDSWPVDRRPATTTVYSTYEPYYAPRFGYGYGYGYGWARPYRGHGHGHRHW